MSLLLCPTDFLRVKTHGKSTNIWINKGCRGVICIGALNPVLEEEPGKRVMDAQYWGGVERQRIPLIARWNADYRAGDDEQS